MEPYDVPGLVGKVFRINMDTVDIKTRPDLIDQYVQLRNKYADLLLTNPVNADDTKEWVKRKNIIIRGITENDELLGAFVIYTDRENEIAFFVKDRDKGVGTRLLDIAQQAAREQGLASIWAWVMQTNVMAQHVFEKCGFTKEAADAKCFNNTRVGGVRYTKYLK